MGADQEVTLLPNVSDLDFTQAAVDNQWKSMNVGGTCAL